MHAHPDAARSETPEGNDSILLRTHIHPPPSRAQAYSPPCSARVHPLPCHAYICSSPHTVRTAAHHRLPHTHPLPPPYPLRSPGMCARLPRPRLSRTPALVHVSRAHPTTSVSRARTPTRRRMPLSCARPPFLARMAACRCLSRASSPSAAVSHRMRSPGACARPQAFLVCKPTHCLSRAHSPSHPDPPHVLHRLSALSTRCLTASQQRRETRSPTCALSRAVYLLHPDILMSGSPFTPGYPHAIATASHVHPLALALNRAAVPPRP
ncbi:hypothetical protein EVG20_g11200, partial [Dentipellis fragilis]